MEGAVSTVTKRGQTAIPLGIRKKFNIQTKTKLKWFTDGKVIIVVPIPPDPIHSFRGKAKLKNLTHSFFLQKKRKEELRDETK
jgi:bifunctional DNA-binding transcriptional regulator/antitoxin component of YhaV-PrlF toxin-antitoxin module